MNNNFTLYWYRSLADTLDTTYINRLGLPAKTLAESKNYPMYAAVLLTTLSVIYHINLSDLLNFVYNLVES